MTRSGIENTPDLLGRSSYLEIGFVKGVAHCLGGVGDPRNVSSLERQVDNAGGGYSGQKDVGE